MTTGEKFNKLTLGQFLRGVPGLRAGHRDVLHALASYGNYDLTGIKPAIDTVARDHFLRPNTVRDTIKDLVDKGLLAVVIDGGGRHRPTEYRLVRPRETLSENDSESNENPVGLRSETLSENDENPVGLRSETLSENDSRPVKDQLKTSLKTTNEKTSAAEASPDDAFTSFFKAYPRALEMDEAKARAAYRDARAKESDEVLIACARQYAAASNNLETRYIKYPGNWLKEERWKDWDLVPIANEFDEGTKMVTRVEYNRIMAEAKARDEAQVWM